MGVNLDKRLITKVDQEISNSNIHNETKNTTNDSDIEVRR